MPIALEASGSVPKTHEGAFTDRLRAPRVFTYKWEQHFRVPRFRMLDVEHRVNGKIVPLFGRHTHPPQADIDQLGPPGAVISMTPSAPTE